MCAEAHRAASGEASEIYECERSTKRKWQDTKEDDDCFVSGEKDWKKLKRGKAVVDLTGEDDDAGCPPKKKAKKARPKKRDEVRQRRSEG